MEYDETLNAYRVLPKALSASFAQEALVKMRGKATVPLKAGHYLIGFESPNAQGPIPK